MSVPGPAADVARPLHVAVLGPIATKDCARLIGQHAHGLPVGSEGAPLLVGLIESLLGRGLRVSAFTLSADLPMGSAPVQVQGRDGLTLVYLPLRPRAWPPNGWRPGRIVDLYFFERQALRRSLRAAQPDLVHAHWCYEYAWAAQQSGLPVVVTCHDSPMRIAGMYTAWRHVGYRRLRAAIARHVLRRAPTVTVVSPYMAREIAALCGATEPALVPNPLAAGIARRALRPPDDARRRVLMVCNGWGTRKNPEVGLQAFARLVAQQPGVELVLLGQDFGPGQTAQQWWQAQGLAGTVHFVGAVSHDQVLDWMQRCDVLLHPALEESFGLVLAEALALGTAVVAGADSGAVPWVVGAEAQLVDVRDPQAVADGLVAALQQARDPLRRERARQTMLQRFEPEAVTEQYLAAYRRALHGRLPRPQPLSQAG